LFIESVLQSEDKISWCDDRRGGRVGIGIVFVFVLFLFPLFLFGLLIINDLMWNDFSWGIEPQMSCKNRAELNGVGIGNEVVEVATR